MYHGSLIVDQKTKVCSALVQTSLSSGKEDIDHHVAFKESVRLRLVIIKLL